MTKIQIIAWATEETARISDLAARAAARNDPLKVELLTGIQVGIESVVERLKRTP